MNEQDGKLVAIVSHLTLIGWIVALVMNQSNKTEIGTFYLRQNLGFILISFVVYIPVLGWIIGLGVLVLWIISVINAVSGSTKPVPVLGDKFQEWFSMI